MNYYEQYKNSYLPILKGRYIKALKEKDYKTQDEIKNIVFDNEKLREFQKREFWDIITGEKSLYGW